MENIENLTLKVYEIKKYDYRQLLKEKGTKKDKTDNELSFDIIKKNQISFVSKQFLRAEDFSNGVCKINVTAYLQPNSRYVLEFSSQNLTPLTDGQKAELETAIKTDAQIQSMLKAEIAKNFTPGTVLSALSWKALIQNLSNQANAVIRSVNANYVIKGEIDNSSLINKILINNINFKNSLHVIRETYVESIEDSLMTKANTNRTNVLNRLSDDSARYLQSQRNADWINITEADIELIANALRRLTNKKLIADTLVKNKLIAKENEIEKKLKEVFTAKEAFIQSFLDLKIKSVFFGTGEASTYSPDFVERAKQHVTFDAGYAYVWGIDRGNAYVGMNIYFRGVDTSLPLKNYRAGFKDYMGSHFSLLIGLSVESIKKDSVRKGLLGNGSALITGVGYKLLPWFKINGGAYLYYKFTVNPLYDKQRLSFTASPFISLSIDVNLSTLFNSFSNGNIFKQL